MLRVPVLLPGAPSLVLLALLTARSLSTALAPPRPAPPDTAHLTCLPFHVVARVVGACIFSSDLSVWIWVQIWFVSQKTFFLKPTQLHCPAGILFTL